MNPCVFIRFLILQTTISCGLINKSLPHVVVIGYEMTQPLKHINNRHRRFCELIVQGMTRRESAIEAGFSPRSAGAMADNLMTDQIIKAEVERLRRGAVERAEVSVERVLQEIMAIAFFDVIHLFNDDGSLKPLSDMTETARRAIGGLEVVTRQEGGHLVDITKIKLVGKSKALDQLAKYLKMYSDVEVNVNIDLSQRLKHARHRINKSSSAIPKPEPEKVEKVAAPIIPAIEKKRVDEVKETPIREEPITLSDRLKAARKRVETTIEQVDGVSSARGSVGWSKRDPRERRNHSGNNAVASSDYQPL